MTLVLMLFMMLRLSINLKSSEKAFIPELNKQVDHVSSALHSKLVSVKRRLQTADRG